MANTAETLSIDSAMIAIAATIDRVPMCFVKLCRFMVPPYILGTVLFATSRYNYPDNYSSVKHS